MLRNHEESTAVQTCHLTALPWSNWLKIGSPQAGGGDTAAGHLANAIHPGSDGPLFQKYFALVLEAPQD